MRSKREFKKILFDEYCKKSVKFKQHKKPGMDYDKQKDRVRTEKNINYR